MNQKISPRNTNSKELSIKIIRADELQTEVLANPTLGFKQELDRYLKANRELEDRLQQEQFKSIDLMMKIQMCQALSRAQIISLKSTIQDLEKDIFRKSEFERHRITELAICHNKINELEQTNKKLEAEVKGLKQLKQTLISQNMKKISDSLWFASKSCESKIKTKLEMADNKIKIMDKTISNLKISLKQKQKQRNGHKNILNLDENTTNITNIHMNVNINEQIWKLLSHFEQKWDRLYSKMSTNVQNSNRNPSTKQVDQCNQSDESTKQDKQICIIDKITQFNKKYLRLFEQLAAHTININVNENKKITNTTNFIQLQSQNSGLKQSINKLQQQNAKTIKYLQISQNFIVMLQKQLQTSYDANKQAQHKSREIQMQIIKTNYICEENNEFVISQGLKRLNQKYSMKFKYS